MATPYQACQQYAVGNITREQLIENLSSRDYPPMIFPTHPYDDLMIDPPGSFGEVETAYHQRLIEDHIIETVWSKRHGHV